ncbi:TPA: fimbriae Y protein [Citrobacter freundii]|nr:fimbriae Y protein [Citrobacter freundii]HED3837385.1 fimbriae Y protein [Citrobacter freundii]HED3842191.1 fimbriae Y protein [Citrobacter freundii]HEO1689327.1 fimbriae Y protein [Citrobacter freundii]
MHSAKRRDRYRRIRNTNCTWQYPHCTSQVFDRLEYLAQKLEYTLPDDTISQAIITTDYYLAYALSRHLFSGTRTAVFQSVESALPSMQEPVISQLVIDIESLTLPYFDILERLRQLIKQRNDIQIFIMLSSRDEDLTTFISLSGPFYILSRKLRLPEVRHALLSPVPDYIHSRRINQLDWEMIALLLQGNSLKKIALLQTQPYHRIIYRLNQLITRLGLPSRQRFLHLIHRLNVTSLHLI